MPKRVPIHVTDMQTFCTCRRLWDWSSTLRRGLQPAILPEALFTGQAVHLALDHGYKGSVGQEVMHFDVERAMASLAKWIDDQQARIDAYTGPLWEEERERLQDTIILGLSMLQHYDRWAAKYDGKYEVLGTEKMFEVPLPRSRGLSYAGRFDGLVRDRTNGHLYILEFKTSKHISPSKLEPIFRSMQATAYIWAACQVYDAYVVGVLYRILRKKIPDIPRMTATGTFSKDKTQSLTEEWLDYCLEAMAQQDAQDTGRPYEEALEELRGCAAGLRGMVRGKANEFFRSQVVSRGKGQLVQAVETLRVLGAQMANPRTPTPQMPGIHCSWCRFSDACDLMNAGYEREAEDLLEAEYAPREYWEEGVDA